MGERAVRTVLIVDDDAALVATFQRAFTRMGKRVLTASTAAIARRLAKDHRPDFALVDLRIGADWGIDVIADLRAEVPELEIALVSGYLSVAAAVAAMRAGAQHVFFKPVTTTTILQQVEHGVAAQDPRSDAPPTLARVEREHLMRAIADCGGNISAAARQLGIRRQSLQQRLKKTLPLD
jgi:two-component system response regulator RegA